MQCVVKALNFKLRPHPTYQKYTLDEIIRLISTESQNIPAKKCKITKPPTLKMPVLKGVWQKTTCGLSGKVKGKLAKVVNKVKGKLAKLTTKAKARGKGKK
jgi:hypothetical protein